MTTEFNDLVKNRTWTLVAQYDAKNVVRNK